MKKIKILIPILAGILIMGLMNSCEPDDLTYTGDPVIELRYSSDSEYDLKSYDILAQLVGPLQSTPTTVNFSVVTAETDAVEGVDYDFITDRTFEIPANSSSAYISLDINEIPSGEIKVLTLQLEDSDFAPSQNYKTFELEMEGPTVGFSGSSKNVNNGPLSTTVTVNLRGTPRPSDETIEFEVDATSTAVAGVHYHLVSVSPLTLTAGSTSITIAIDILNGLSVGDANVTIVLDLLNTGSLVPNSASRYTITIVAPTS